MTRPELRRWTRNIIKKMGWHKLMHDNPGLRVFKKVLFAKRMDILNRFVEGRRFGKTGKVTS